MKITPFHVEMMGKRSSRHNILRDAIFATAAGALLAPLEEERALLPGSNNRPADVLIPHWTGDQLNRNGSALEAGLSKMRGKLKYI